jgi:hypothetical protein
MTRIGAGEMQRILRTGKGARPQNEKRRLKAQNGDRVCHRAMCKSQFLSSELKSEFGIAAKPRTKGPSTRGVPRPKAGANLHAGRSG